MIQSLRRQHRVMIVLLAVGLIVLFIAGLSARRTLPVNPQVPDVPLQAPAGGTR